MVVWRAPAATFLVISMLVGIGMLLLSLPFVDRNASVDGLTFALVYLTIPALLMTAMDIVFRVRSRLGLFDLRASTFFWILPTWLVGLAAAIIFPVVASGT
ncbi:MAG: hypothetical protein GC208_03025 [Alphaproteobacteria bacterium]|nr:hypothetical protein [Alphaproteobacteria bacterium]